MRRGQDGDVLTAYLEDKGSTPCSSLLGESDEFGIIRDVDRYAFSCHRSCVLHRAAVLSHGHPASLWISRTCCAILLLTGSPNLAFMFELSGRMSFGANESQEGNPC
jgi:hypothetical protein